MKTKKVSDFWLSKYNIIEEPFNTFEKKTRYFRGKSVDLNRATWPMLHMAASEHKSM